ncbi:MAG: LCP family protein [Clostridia bacterium]|nr:LCP family protein [Clostridia bacterium]
MPSNNNMTPKERRRHARKRVTAVFNVIIVLAIIISAVAAISAGRGLNITKPGDNIDIEAGDGAKIALDDASADRKPGVYNILVYGRDKVAMNSDTIMVANFDATAGKINILHIPRDTVYIDDNGHQHKINYVYATEGREGLIKELQQLLGIHIDKYISITTDAFREIVDAIGGVEVDVPQDMQYEDPYQDLVIDIKAGKQVLDGEKAEGFVRFRSGYYDADLGRIKAQKQFIAAFIRTMLKPANIVKVSDIAQIAFDKIDTDLERGEFLYIALQCATIGMSDATFYTIPGENYGANFAMYRDEAAQLMNDCFNVYTTPIVPDDLETFDFKHQLTESVTDYQGTTAQEYEAGNQTAGVSYDDYNAGYEESYIEGYNYSDEYGYEG